MKDRTLKNQKKHINKTLKQFRLAKRLIQLSITGTVSVITASLSFYFCPGFSSQVKCYTNVVTVVANKI